MRYAICRVLTRVALPEVPRWLACCLALGLLAATACADIIHYTDGRTLEGVIVERTETALKVQTSFGTIDVPLSKVERIEERLTPGQQLSQQRATVADDDAPALFVLAQWAAEHKLRKQSRELMAEVLAADPLHEGANLALGRVRVDGRWFDPEEVDAYLASVAAERKAKGLVLFDGDWIPEAEANRRRGLALYQGQWMPRREAATRSALKDLAEQVGWSTRATESEYFTVFGDLDEETTEYLLHDLDAAVKDFLKRCQPSDSERKRLVGREVPIYLVPDRETSLALLDTGFLAARYPLLPDARERFASLNVYGMNLPAAFFVLIDGSYLNQNGDPDAARTGFLSHELGRLLVDRFKGSRSAPGWVTVAMAAYYEGVTNYYSTVSLSGASDEEQSNEVEWVRGWEHYGEWRDQLRDEHVQANLPPLRHMLRDPVDSFDSQEVGIVWSLLRFLLEKHQSEFFHYLRVFDSDPFAVATDLPAEHERAWALSFAATIDETQAQWRDWSLTQPKRFPSDELDR